MDDAGQRAFLRADIDDTLRSNLYDAWRASPDVDAGDVAQAARYSQSLSGTSQAVLRSALRSSTRAAAIRAAGRLDSGEFDSLLRHVEDLSSSERVAVFRSVAEGDVYYGELVDNLDSVQRIEVDGGDVVVHGERSTVTVQSRVVEDGDAFLDDAARAAGIDDPDDLTRGQLGEAVADDEVRAHIRATMDPGDEVDDYIYKGFDPDEVNDPGPDLVWEDPETGDIVVEEVKFRSSSGNFDPGELGTVGDDVTQMSERWVRDVVDERRGIDSETAIVIEDAIEGGRLRRDISVIQNRPVDGYTITDSIGRSLGIDAVNLYKIGVQR